MQLTQRTIGLALMIILTLGTTVFAISNVVTHGLMATEALIGLGTLLLFGVLLFSYWRGWDRARYFVIIVLVFGVYILPEPYVTDEFAATLFIGPVVALILASPLWVVGAAIIEILLMATKANFTGVYTSVTDLAIFAIIVGGMILARLIADRAYQMAEANAARAEVALHQAEEQTKALAVANEAANRQLEEQRRLLELVATLETPAMQLADGVLFAPLVGHLDSRRTQEFTSRLLQAAHAQRARHIVIDIAGVTMVDTAVARALIGTVQSLRLLGCEVTISGISSNIAITLTQLGIDLTGVTTVRNPQEALARAMGTLKSGAGGEQLAAAPKLNGARKLLN